MLEHLKSLKESSKIVDELRRHLRLTYIKPGEEVELRGYCFVYKGLVHYSGEHYEEGEHFKVNGKVRADRESILVTLSEELVERGSERAEVGYECTVKDVIVREPVSVKPDVSIKKAIEIMDRENISSVVVVNDSNIPIGILTDTDIKRLLTRRVDFSKPIGSIAIKRLVTIGLEDSCFDAIVLMLSNYIKHLVVLDSSGRLAGVITIRDLVYKTSVYPYYLAKVVPRTTDLKTLRTLYEEFNSWIRRLGARAFDVDVLVNPHQLTKVVSLAYDSFVKRAVEMAVQEAKGPPPCPFAVVVLGSEGRMEQFVKTDMDNMLIYECKEHREYFEHVSERAVELLDKMGFPPCREGYTMNRLLMSVEEAKQLAANALERLPETAVLISLIQDGRVVHGSTNVFERLRESVMRGARAKGHIVLGESLRFKPPIGPLGMLKGKFRVKEEMLAPIVMPIRALSMLNGVTETNTVDRIKQLLKLKVLPESLAEELEWAFITALRLAIWAKSNNINIVRRDAIPILELVKAAAKTANKLHKYIEIHYGIKL